MSRSDYVPKFVDCEQCGKPVDEEEAVWQITTKSDYTPFHGTCEKWKFWRDKWRAANPFKVMEAPEDVVAPAPKRRGRPPGSKNSTTPKVAAKPIITRRRRTKAEIEAGILPFNRNTEIAQRPDLAKRRGRKPKTA